MTINREDILNAYRQFKNFIYHENLQLFSSKIVRFEAEIEKKIKNIIDFITSKEDNPEWINEDGYFTIIKDYSISDHGLIFTNVQERWSSIKDTIERVEFRIISDLSIETHIISILWINKVALAYESSLSNNCYGTRLSKRNKEADRPQIFTNYLSDYKNWQLNGIKAIKNEFYNRKSIIAITADINSFYHNVDYSLLKNKKFYNSINQETPFSEDMQDLSNKIHYLINDWSKKVFQELSEHERERYSLGHVGLPIGLPLSKVFANLILKELDDDIIEELSPIYYGRYVDDMFLVIGSNSKIKNRLEFWKFLQKRMKVKINDEDKVFLELKHSGSSRFFFNQSKEKFFYLDYKYGSNLIGDIEKELNKNSSEWRFVPENGEDLESLAEELLTSSSDGTEPANSLRKSDGVSIRRLKFAHYLSTLEDYVLDHPVEFWKEGIKKITDVVSSIIIEPITISAYIQYLPRFLKLLQFSKHKYLFDKVEKSLTWTISELKNLTKKDGIEKDLCEHMIQYIDRIIKESKICGYNFLDDLFPNTLACESLIYFFSDLHFLPLNSVFINDQLFENLIDRNLSGTTLRWRDSDLLTKVLEGKLNLIMKTPDYLLMTPGKEKHYSGFEYYTRSLSIFNISRAVENFIENKTLYNNLCELYNQSEIYPEINELASNVESLSIALQKTDPRIALSSYLVEQSSWDYSVRAFKEPDKTRLDRLYKLINNILRCEKKCDMIVFPELSLNEFSINQIYRQIKGSEIIFVSGVDYKYDRANSAVINRLVYLLPIKAGNKIYHLQLFQEKSIGAIHEISELNAIKGLKLISKNKKKYIINYNGFSFASLICNEFLNIDYRSQFRGKIDALFLLEWNKDLEYYNSLVESTANDLHTFIVQVNNRCYGDTRLRGPYKESHKRDVARVRGGEVDYFVMAKLEIKYLRDFQNHYISPTDSKALFKPLPIGYELSSDRKM